MKNALEMCEVLVPCRSLQDSPKSLLYSAVFERSEVMPPPTTTPQRGGYDPYWELTSVVALTINLDLEMTT